MHESDNRYPYTYACDYIRGVAGYDKGGTKISRGDASNIISSLSKILDMDYKTLAGKTADAEINKTDEERDQESIQIMKAMGLYSEI